MSLKVTSWVWEHSDEKGTDLLLMLALADQANDDGECWPRKKILARKARMSERTVERRMAYLVGKGRVERTARPGHSNIWRVVMTLSTPLVESDPAPPVKMWGGTDCGGVQIDGGSPPQPDGGSPPQPDPPEPSIEPSKNHPSTATPSEVAELRDAVMDGMAKSAPKIARRLQRAGVASAAEILLSQGWTPDTIREWIREQSWADAGPGAVVHRLKTIGDAPAAAPPPPGCDDCTAGWLPEHTDGRPRPCPHCRPWAASG